MPPSYHWRDHFSPDDGAPWADWMLDRGYIGEEAHALALAEIDAHGCVRTRVQVRAEKLKRRERDATATRGLHPSMQLVVNNLFAPARVAARAA